MQIVPKLFAQTVLLFGWVVFWGGSPLHESQGRKQKLAQHFEKFV